MRKKEDFGAFILIKGHRCYRCGYDWRPERLDVKPKVCPHCKSPYWDKPRQSNKSKKSAIDYMVRR